MVINNLDKIIGLVGLVMGIEIIAVAIFLTSILYIRNPVGAGLIANISSLTMILGVISYTINRERK